MKGARDHPIWWVRTSCAPDSVPRVTGPTETASQGATTSADGLDTVPVPAEAGAPERRPGDIGRFAIGVMGFAVAGLWAQTRNNVDANLFTVVNDLPDSLDGVANVFAFLGSIWFVGIIVVVLLLARWFPAARDATVAAGGAWLIALGCNELFGTRSASSLGITVRSGNGPETLRQNI